MFNNIANCLLTHHHYSLSNTTVTKKETITKYTLELSVHVYKFGLSPGKGNNLENKGWKVLPPSGRDFWIFLTTKEKKEI